MHAAALHDREPRTIEPIHTSEGCGLPITLAAVRRLIVGTQGFNPRFRRAGAAEVEATIRRLSAVQLDSISAVDRAHRLTLSARVGAFELERVEHA